MIFIKKNYGWILVTLLAALPLLVVFNMLQVNFSPNFSITLANSPGQDSKDTIAKLYHVSGEFAVRWMTAVLTCTPFFILFGVNNLYVRQAMGIAAAIWSFLHFIIFVAAENFEETFTQVNYIAGFIAILILIALFVTSNRKSMKYLKSNWKKLQSLSYLAVFLSLLHIALLEKTYMIYAIIVGIGFILRIPTIKTKIIGTRKRRKFVN